MIMPKHFSSESEASSPVQPHLHLYIPQVCEYSWLLTLYSRVMLHCVFWPVLSFTIILPTYPKMDILYTETQQSMLFYAHLHIH